MKTHGRKSSEKKKILNPIDEGRFFCVDASNACNESNLDVIVFQNRRLAFKGAVLEDDYTSFSIQRLYNNLSGEIDIVDEREAQRDNHSAIPTYPIKVSPISSGKLCRMILEDFVETEPESDGLSTGVDTVVIKGIGFEIK